MDNQSENPHDATAPASFSTDYTEQAPENVAEVEVSFQFT